MFLQELKKFSRENWWIYIIFGLFLPIIYIYRSGNILEISFLLIGNLIANVGIMAAIGNYSKNNNTAGAIFHITGSFTLTILGVYGYLFRNEVQYLIWQIPFSLAAIKAIGFYKFNKKFSYINAYTVGTINIIALLFFIYFGSKLNFYVVPGTILMCIGFSIASTGLVSIQDNFRYWGNYFGAFFITIGASILTYQGFLSQNISGLDLGYFAFTLTSFIYFSKLLPQYVKKLTAIK